MTTTASKELATKPNLIKTVHIDTSLQIERLKGHKKAEIIEHFLKDYNFTTTSSFAKLEFKGAWLKDLAYLYHSSQNLKRIEELIGHVNDKLGASPYSKRRLSRCIEAIVSFLDKIPGELPFAVMLLRVRNHILNSILGAYPWWERSVHHEYDGTKCVRAKEHPQKRSGGKIDVAIGKCSHRDIKCAIHEFFEENKHHFLAIRNAIESNPKPSDELQNAIEIITEAEKDPKNLCNSGNCRKLGDVIIAIDGVDMDSFAANNDKEWKLLAETLGKNLINPVRPQ